MGLKENGEKGVHGKAQTMNFQEKKEKGEMMEFNFNFKNEEKLIK